MADIISTANSDRRHATDLLLKEFVEKAKTASIEALYESYDDDEGNGEEEEPGIVHLELPNGRKTRKIYIDGRDAQILLQYDLSSIRGAGDYMGVVNTQEDMIEVFLTSTQSGIFTAHAPVWTLPGAESMDKEIEGDLDLKDDDEIRISRKPSKWRLRVESESRVMEISPPSKLARAICGPRNPTIKLKGFNVSRHDDAITALETVGGAFLFDLDVKYGMTLRFVRRRNRIRSNEQDPVKHPPEFPRNEYSQEALSLYQYARGASALPLLQFLAFYQSIEYFFPVFAREETVRSLRAALLNPRFNPTDDAKVNQLINLAAPAVRAGVSERDQLRAAVRASVDQDALQALIESSESYKEHFCSNKQKIHGANPIKLRGDQIDLRDQVADRLYKIRCRVVHTKQDGTGQGEELLLPSSPEADALGPDIDLLRLIAQQALVARAQRTS